MSSRRRAGRPKKAGPRYPGGQHRHTESGVLIRDARENERHGRWQRRHLIGIVSHETLLDPLCGDPLGILHVGKRLSEAQYQAGIHYRATAEDYRRMNGLPSGLPKPLGQKGISHYQADPEIAENVRKRYFALRQRIVKAGGFEALSAIQRICSNERMIDAGQFDALVLGLDALADVRPAKRKARSTG